MTTRRNCRTCTLCCRLIAVRELAKGPDTRCQFVSAEHDHCTIYATRPNSCRKFSCQWLVNPSLLGDEWFPLTCGIVVTSVHAAGRPTLVFHVDPNRPDAWQQPPYRERIAKIASAIPGTMVRIGERWLNAFNELIISQL
jgi:hypothetical protein